MKAHTENAEAWRNIDRSTKAGRMLSQIYGGHTKTKIQYPSVKRRQNSCTSRPRYVGGTHRVNTTSHQRRRNKQTVRVPRPIPSNSHAIVEPRFPLPSRPARKPRHKIHAEMQRVVREIPAAKKAISTKSVQHRRTRQVRGHIHVNTAVHTDL